MKMRVNICGCLLAFALGCNVTAEIIHEVFEEKASISPLRCPHSVEGKVTWSREINGNKVDILTVDGDGDIRHNDPGRRYSSLNDKSLHIRRAAVSDTGRYFCNNEPAVELTVIPSGTVRLTATERTGVTLKCPPDVGGSDVPTWSRDTGEIQQQRRFYVSPVNKTLTIADVQPGDSGLYYCDGKPAVYLNVIKEGKKNTPSATTATTQTAAATVPSTTLTKTDYDCTTMKKQSHAKKPRNRKCNLMNKIKQILMFNVC
ncbi:hemicentin-2-like isoform X1 [Siniperca chuatsi]|uniref:hemicentin-2-like isoform X1 n=1 Tax=Siniperca chuatsi TaxID=119488 RepID=UPI001CE1C8D8|nr:hemicentin-2-like isoform X1 [Siniperca chuatsi]